MQEYGLILQNMVVEYMESTSVINGTVLKFFVDTKEQHDQSYFEL